MSDEREKVEGGRPSRKSWISSALAGIFAVTTLVLTLIQISEDVETLSSPSEVPTEQFVIDTK